MEKTNGTWSHKDGVLKCGSEVVVNYIKDIRTGWQLMQRLELFDWVCKTLNKQELLDERLEKQLKDLKPIVNETNETHEKDCNHTLADEFILLLKHKKNDKQVIMNGLDSSKTAKLHLEKVVLDGKKTFKLMGFENIPMLDQLPKEYKCGGAYFFFNRPVNSISLIRYIGNAGDKSCVEYKVGDIIQPETLEIFKRCAERLASINKKLKEVKPERFTVSI